MYKYVFLLKLLKIVKFLHDFYILKNGMASQIQYISDIKKVCKYVFIIFLNIGKTFVCYVLKLANFDNQKFDGIFDYFPLNFFDICLKLIIT